MARGRVTRPPRRWCERCQVYYFAWRPPHPRCSGDSNGPGFAALVREQREARRAVASDRPKE